MALERTPCLGTCPAYRVSVDASGEVRWLGTRFVAALGEAVSTVTPFVVRRLWRQVCRMSFFELADTYDLPVLDAPRAIVTAKAAGREKRVVHLDGWHDRLLPPEQRPTSYSQRGDQHAPSEASERHHRALGYRGEREAWMALSRLERAIDRELGTRGWIGEGKR